MAELTSNQSIKQAKRIRRLWKSGDFKTRRQLADHLGLPYQRVQKILVGRLAKSGTAPIPEGNYREYKALGKTVFIYDDGRVWSTVSNRFIGSVHKSGYKMFSFVDPNTKKLINFRVSRIMLEVFVRAPKDGECARHLDDHPGNNTLKNLAWGYPQDNSDDCVHNGNSAKGTRNTKHKLTEKIVRKIVRTYKDEPYKTFAKQFVAKHNLDVTQLTVVRILRGQTWAHVTGYVRD